MTSKSDVFVGYMLYADDIVSHSHRLCLHYKRTVDVCASFTLDIDMKFNSKKSVVMRVGPRFKEPSEPIQPTTNNLFSAIKTNIGNTIANNSGRRPEKPYGSMNWSPM